MSGFPKTGHYCLMRIQINTSSDGANNSLTRSSWYYILLNCLLPLKPLLDSLWSSGKPEECWPQQLHGQSLHPLKIFLPCKRENSKLPQTGEVAPPQQETCLATNKILNEILVRIIQTTFAMYLAVVMFLSATITAILIPEALARAPEKRRQIQRNLYR